MRYRVYNRLPTLTERKRTPTVISNARDDVAGWRKARTAHTCRCTGSRSKMLIYPPPKVTLTSPSRHFHYIYIHKRLVVGPTITIVMRRTCSSPPLKYCALAPEGPPLLFRYARIITFNWVGYAS